MERSFNGQCPDKDGFICDACDKEFDISVMDVTPYYRMAGFIYCLPCYDDNGVGLAHLEAQLPERA